MHSTVRRGVVGQDPRTVPASESIETQLGRRVTPLDCGCWQWDDGSTDYPQIKLHGEPVAVHRWIYFTTKPHVEEWEHRDKHVHHECQNKRCVNPRHMRLLTPAEHAARHQELSARPSN